uniref:Uncharacterized protein n=1 Tax=Arundo donax TaxID=35708 RepID=A0A0A9DAM4_ARUDO
MWHHQLDLPSSCAACKLNLYYAYQLLHKPQDSPVVLFPSFYASSSFYKDSILLPCHCIH